jgi:hypothetical protein
VALGGRRLGSGAKINHMKGLRRGKRRDIVNSWSTTVNG